MDLTAHPALLVMAIAVAASLLAELRIGMLQVPVVVWEMGFGMLVGSQGLGLARSSDLLEWVGRAGLAALFFMSGMELDLQKVKGRPLSLAVCGWSLSLAIALAAGVVFHWVPQIHAPLMVSLVLTTTAMGTFLPILRDAGHLDSKFGSFVLAAGVVGEFGPVILVSLALTRVYGTWKEVALMLGFVALAVVAALMALSVRPPRVLRLLERSMQSSTQLPVVLSVLLIAAFVSLSRAMGLESVLGAFAAGMVVGLASQGGGGKVFRVKIEAICFGFLVPFFFVVSGMNLEVGLLVKDPEKLLLVPVFLLLFFIVRGTPVVLYRHDIAKSERLPFVLFSATALPMVVAITDIGVRTGRLLPEIAAALVGAGLLSVLLFPAVAIALLPRRSLKEP